MSSLTPARAVAARPRLGAMLTMAAMLGFASMDAMSKFLVQDYPVTQILWVRYGVFTLFTLLVAGPRGLRRAMFSRRPWLQTGRALLGLLENAVFVLAFLYLPLAETHAVAATSPLIVVALSALLLGERATRRRWLAVGTGFLGVLLIIRPGFQALEWPLLVPLAGALLWALYQVLTRLTARTDTPQTTLLWTAALGLLATSLVGPLQWRDPDMTGWLLLACVSLLGSLSHYALIRALDFAEAGAVQPYSYSLLVWAALLGALVFGDIPPIWTVLGATVVVISGLATWRQDEKPAPQQ